MKNNHEVEEFGQLIIVVFLFVAAIGFLIYVASIVLESLGF